MRGNLYHSIFVQQGSSHLYRVSDESLYMVLDEAWQGKQLLNTTVLASFPGTPQGKDLAEEEAKKIRRERLVDMTR